MLKRNGFLRHVTISSILCKEPFLRKITKFIFELRKKQGLYWMETELTPTATNHCHVPELFNPSAAEEIPRFLWNPESLIPCSQETANGPPKSTPHPHTLFTYNTS
jgi:hypothetical protein